MLAMDTSLWSDDVCVIDFHSGGVRPVEGDCPAQRRRRVSAVRLLCQSQPYFWGLRLHLVCTLTELPVLFALVGAKADEREVLPGMLEEGRDVADGHPGQVVIGDKNYFGRHFENDLAERELVLLRPARKGEARRAGQHLFKPLRQVIESVNWTFKRPAGPGTARRPDPEGIIAHVLTRILALTAAGWHNDKTGQQVKRPLTAYNHRPSPAPLESSI
jgi:hypothetical protein